MRVYVAAAAMLSALVFHQQLAADAQDQSVYSDAQSIPLPTASEDFEETFVQEPIEQPALEQAAQAVLLSNTSFLSDDQKKKSLSNS